MSNLIGLDVGTTGCKAVVFDLEERCWRAPAASTPWSCPTPAGPSRTSKRCGRWRVESMGEAIAAAGVREVAAIGLSVHGEAITPVDAFGRPLRPTILGMDTRTDAQNEWLRERFGAQALFELTGMPIHTVNTLPKLLWIREHEPDDLGCGRQVPARRGLPHRAHDRPGLHQLVPGIAHAAVRAQDRRLVGADPRCAGAFARPAGRDRALGHAGRYPGAALTEELGLVARPASSPVGTTRPAEPLAWA